MKLAKNEYKEFTPGSIFGFKTDGIKYVYNDSLKKYVAILFEDKTINFFVGETEKVIYKGIVVDNTFFYSTEVGGQLKVFNKENIYKDFGNSKMAAILLDLKLTLEMNELEVDMHRHQFAKAKKLIERYLSKASGNANIH